jgi:DNA-binding SARP family transcriptional activator
MQRALHWTGLLLDMWPDDERALRRAIALLERVGDRPAAIRLYKEFARRIQEEYEVQPSAQTRALIATLRVAVPAPEPGPPTSVQGKRGP